MAIIVFIYLVIGAIELGIVVKVIVEVFFGILHYIVALYLPVVFGAVTTLERLVLGLFNSGKNIDIFVVNINAENKKIDNVISLSQENLKPSNSPRIFVAVNHYLYQ